MKYTKPWFLGVFFFPISVMANKDIEKIKGIKILEKRGDAFFDAEMYEEAVDTYLEVLLQDTGNVSINIKIGESYLKSGQYTEAKQTFEEIKRIKPDHVIVRNYLHVINVQEIILKGDKYRENKEYKKALETYYQAFKVDPKSIEALHGAALVYLEEEKVEKAINIFNKIMEMDSIYQEEYKHILNHVAISLGKHGLHDKAISLYQKAISLDPNDEVLFFNLSGAFIRSNKYQEAKTFLEKAIELDPSFEEAKNLLEKISLAHTT